MVTSTDPRKVPQGLIHHWLGALFIPGAQIDQVLQVLNDYGRYSEMYKPLIRKAYLIERNGDTVKLSALAETQVDERKLQSEAAKRLKSEHSRLQKNLDTMYQDR